MSNIIYIDNAAGEPIEIKVYGTAIPFLHAEYGNPSGLYSLGATAKDAIEESRKNIADLIHAKPEEICFTSSATESNNWVLKNIAHTLKKSGVGNHIVTTAIEHKSVINTCKYLEEEGYEVTYLPVDSNGLIDLVELSTAIREDTILVSVMMANNEIGTIEPIHKIGEICTACDVLFHVDATQALGKIPIDVNEMYIDFLSASAHKIGGLSGCGILYCHENLKPILKTYNHGGHQEFGLNSGTENVVGIVSFGEAAKLKTENMVLDFKKTYDNVRWLSKELLKIQGSHLNGVPNVWDTRRLWNNINIRFDGVNASQLQGILAEKGICVSTGSACNNGENVPSHVLKAIGLSDKECSESLRITLSHHNTRIECEYVAEVIKSTVELLRNTV